jgi:hypothetical protein
LRSPLDAAGLALRLTAVVLIATIGWIHLHVWMRGYRVIPTIGPLFLAAAVGGFVIAAALLVWPNRLFGVAGLGLAIGTLVGLILSVNGGLFGFIDTLSAPYATESAVVEVAGALALVGWVVFDQLTDARHRLQTS